MALNCLGEAYARSGDAASAAEWHRRALALGRRCGSAFEGARAQHRLGELAASAGDLASARRHWSEAYATFSDLGAPQAAEVLSRLDTLRP
jgi:hypothetical protein